MFILKSKVCVLQWWQILEGIGVALATLATPLATPLSAGKTVLDCPDLTAVSDNGRVAAANQN